jgi:hypothetical protein
MAASSLVKTIRVINLFLLADPTTRIMPLLRQKAFGVLQSNTRDYAA